MKLARSVADGRVFDLIPEVATRYLKKRPAKVLAEVWTFNRQPMIVAAGGTLRVQAGAQFRLRWTTDEWQNATVTEATLTKLGVSFADIQVPVGQKGLVQFTFFWEDAGHWEGQDFKIRVGH